MSNISERIKPVINSILNNSQIHDQINSNMIDGYSIFLKFENDINRKVTITTQLIIRDPDCYIPLPSTDFKKGPNNSY